MKALDRENFASRFENAKPLFQATVDADYRAWGGEKSYRPILEFEAGTRYVRIVSVSGGSRSAFGFIDRTNGDVLKSNSWKAPAKNFARGNIFDEAFGVGRVKWTGVY